MRNYKTTILGIFALILAIAGVILVAYEKASLMEVGGYLGAITPFVLALGMFLSKDHDKDNNLDFRAEDTINPNPKPPRPPKE